MPTFYKTTLRAIVSNQEVVNVLYYAPQIPTNLTFDPDVAQDLGEAVGLAWLNQMQAAMVTQYNHQSVDVSMVDDDGVTVSDYIVSVPSVWSGARALTLDTYAQVAIAKFTCATVAESAPHRVPRRSYLAIGPVPSEDIAPGGIYLFQSTLQAALSAATTGGHLIGATSYVPYRVGRTVAPSTTDPDGILAGVGRVVSLTVRPYTSFRRSRLISPTGN